MQFQETGTEEMAWENCPVDRCFPDSAANLASFHYWLVGSPSLVPVWIYMKSQYAFAKRIILIVNIRITHLNRYSNGEMVAEVVNIELARTFLEIIAAGNFVTAARRLHVTQSTVSLRIKSLEEQLGRTLFVRTKSGVSLTAAGEQFQRYAITLTQVWEQARHQIAVPQGYSGLLSIGGQYSLWDGYLLNWLQWMRIHANGVSLRAEYGLPGWLMQRLEEGMLDIAVMYTPQTRPGLKIDHLLDDKLILVRANTAPKRPSADTYVYVDWGPEFRSRFSLDGPHIGDTGMVLDLGALALQYVLEHGGSGYFPRRIVSRHLETGALKSVRAPTFTLPAYMVYAEDNDSDALRTAIEGLRHSAATV